MAFLADSKQVAEHFGVTEQTVRTWVREGRVPDKAYVRLPRRYRFDIEAMVEHFRLVSAEDPFLDDVEEVAQEEFEDEQQFIDDDSEFDFTDEDL